MRLGSSRDIPRRCSNVVSKRRKPREFRPKISLERGCEKGARGCVDNRLFSVSVNKNEQLIGDETNARGEVDF